MSFYGYVLTHNEDGTYDGVKIVSSTLGNILALVLGYYFGQRQVQEFSRQTQQATEQRDMFRNRFSDVSTQLEMRQKEYRDLMSDLESIKRELGVT